MELSLIKGLGVQDLFDVVIGAFDVQQGKPNPEIFFTAASKLGLLPSQCIVFEDALTGIEAASRAGMRTVVITTQLTAEEASRQPNVIATAPDFTTLQPNKILQVNLPE
jgi:beta-phosphoglucomutase